MNQAILLSVLFKYIIPPFYKKPLTEDLKMEQNAGTKQINGAINQLNTVSQQNASSAEGLASEAEQLTSQAEQLKEAIAFFKTGKEKTKVKSKNFNVQKGNVQPNTTKIKGAHLTRNNH